jgi:predicted RNA polymerase sigma factor
LAATLFKAGEPVAALAELDALPAKKTRFYQPSCATRAHALAADGRMAEARAAGATAIALTKDEAVLRHLAETFAGGE